jgi:ABC-2 type transport system ATP-binding protein
MSDDIAIKVDHVGKTFKLPHEKQTSVKGSLINFFRVGKATYEKQEVLKDISFEVKKGEFFGIVGRNGSGKSTLLKMLAGIYTPTKGQIQVNGKLTPFIELGVGFNPELTGRENVFLNGALLGFNRKEMTAMYEDIVEFAELERFMDQKLKNYSSGMQVRLAFSIAIRTNTDILVLDEVLAVGDSAFQQKCFDYFAKLKRDKKTVILVTHGMAQVERFCDRAMLIEKGEILEKGPAPIVASKYENLFIEDRNTKKHKDQKKTKKYVDVHFDVEVFTKQQDETVSAVQSKMPFTIVARILSKADMSKLNVGFNIRDSFDNVVFSTDVRMLNEQKEIKISANEQKAVALTLDNYFTNGKYFIDLIMVDEAREGSEKLLYNKKGVASFEVLGITNHTHGMFHPDTKLEVRDEK